MTARAPWRSCAASCPLGRTATPEGIELYRVEPYVVPADVYGVPPYTGRGGWTWYTGTAAWTWRLIVEAILGLRRENGMLIIEPTLPPDWPGFEATVREGKAIYRLKVKNAGPGGGAAREAARVTLDGKRLDEARVLLIDDGREHEWSWRWACPINSRSLFW